MLDAEAVGSEGSLNVNGPTAADTQLLRVTVTEEYEPADKPVFVTTPPTVEVIF